MKRSLFFIIPFIVLTYASLILFQKACDYTMNLQAEKRLPFNHKSHVTKYGTDCETCHGYYDNGRFKGLPTIAECTMCHDRNGENHNPDPLVPTRKAMLDGFKDSDKPWQSFATQPDLVYFSHKVVMTSTFEDGRKKARCGSCHGDKAGSSTTEKIKGKMLMGQCMDCHTALHISNKCLVCHD
ncbi:MAG TPA: cytochrome c3 family protein [Spirochaetota bacterium]|nr:cytochrome c3 family protein [Spirochaetota bacterium]HPI88726.1 cytochrome c3 family protein [Spirochaetota bacterium]HPR48752.1 cytochrome c3 family protein [Spirochaetota bacterium]